MRSADIWARQIATPNVTKSDTRLSRNNRHATCFARYRVYRVATRFDPELCSGLRATRVSFHPCQVSGNPLTDDFNVMSRRRLSYSPVTSYSAGVTAVYDTRDGQAE
jgi:hypothetical protein